MGPSRGSLYRFGSVFEGLACRTSSTRRVATISRKPSTRSRTGRIIAAVWFGAATSVSGTWRILGAWDVSSQRCILALRPLHGNQMQESHRDDGIASNVPCPVVIVTRHVSRGIKCNTAPYTQENSDKRVSSSPLIYSCAPRHCVAALRFQIMTVGSRATGREPFPNMRGGRCRSGAARANRRIHNGSRHPGI